MISINGVSIFPNGGSIFPNGGSIFSNGGSIFPNGGSIFSNGVRILHSLDSVCSNVKMQVTYMPYGIVNKYVT